MTTFQDHFSGHAEAYRQHRPHYPDALFQWLAEQSPDQRLAWDCATGNGQAAAALARHFDHVIATDASGRQIAQAEPAQKVEYRVAPAEHSGLSDRSADLVTVAQAAHWFDLPAFYKEVKRVACDGAVVALWCYGLARITPEVDAMVDDYYHNTVGAYWPPERRHIETAYRKIDFPFPELEPPTFTMKAEWSIDQLLGYLGTWSATRRYMTETGRNPLALLAPALAAAWKGNQAHKVEWPIALRAGNT